MKDIVRRIDESFIQNLLDAIPYLAYIIDADTFEILTVNKETLARYGTVPEGVPCYQFFNQCSAPCEACPVLLHKEELNSNKLVHHAAFSQQTRQWDRTSSSLFSVAGNRTVCFVMSMPREIALEGEQAPPMEDPCTGVANNRLYEEMGQRLLEDARRTDTELSVIALKVDGLHAINSEYGYARGDQALRTLVHAIARNLPEKTLLARRRGNDFSILHACNDHDARTETVALLQQMEKAVAASLKNDCMSHLRVRAGVCLFPSHGRQFDTLNFHARKAMTMTAFSAQNKHFAYGFYDNEFIKALRDKEEMLLDLHQALRRGEMSLVFQPKHDLRSSRIVGAEALIRWNHPERGAVRPDVFIPMAEESLTIPDIDNWVINEVCRQWRQLLDNGYPLVPVSINISPQRFYQRDFIENFEDVLNRHDLPSSLIEVELTERTALQDLDEAVEIMRGLRERGFRVAIDDFGTGYSSLNYLRALAFDTVKLDRTFIADPSDNVHSVLQAIVALVKVYNAEVVFEGVETSDQYDMARTVGCDLIQGYYTGRPMAPECFAELLDKASGDA